MLPSIKIYIWKIHLKVTDLERANFKNIFITMDVLLNGLGISGKGELQRLCCMMGKTISLFGC